MTTHTYTPFHLYQRTKISNHSPEGPHTQPLHYTSIDDIQLLQTTHTHTIPHLQPGEATHTPNQSTIRFKTRNNDL